MAKLGALGVKRMLLAIQDVSFPSDAAEDIGRGAPTTAAAERFYHYVHGLGFTGLQLGPQGQTSRANPSPYDGTVFSRHVGSIAVHSLRAGGALEQLVDESTIDHAVVGAEARGPRAHHVHAWEASQRLVAAAHAAFRAGKRADLVPELAAFELEHASWLERDALFAAIVEQRLEQAMTSWPTADRLLWRPPARDVVRTAARRAQLARDHADPIARYAFGQFLAHREHARVRGVCERIGLALFGDLQIGFSESDAWSYGACFLADYVMGAPPSRTNPEGQPWNYPVLDPEQYGTAAGALVAARADKAFAEYDGLRIDHPHGLVCPWVYRAAQPIPSRPCRVARGYSSRRISRIIRGSPGTRSRARRSSSARSLAMPTGGRARWTPIRSRSTRCSWTRSPTRARAMAGRRRRSRVRYSTLPLPLAKVLERHHLGRWRITQKANLAEPTDVYRAELAQPADWVMIGNHDTAPIFALLQSWPAATKEAWGRHLAARLALPHPAQLTEPRVFASAMLAELFASRAESVQVFYADLVGETERFNSPGTVSDANWTLRLGPDFEQLHADRLAAGTALDVNLACDLALAAPRL